MRAATLASVAFLGLHLTGGAAVAQSGSAGGTIGNTGKSAVGGNTSSPARPPDRAAAPAPPPSPRGGSPCKLASVWANQVSGLGSSVWTISADGKAVEKGLGSAQGRASLSGRKLTITFQTLLNNGVYVVQLDPDCGGGRGTATALGGIGAGTVYTVTFTALPAGAN